MLAFVPSEKTLPKMSTRSLVSPFLREVLLFILVIKLRTKSPFSLLKFLFCLFQLYVSMERSINMSSLMMGTVIGRLLMCILTSVMMMTSKDKVCVNCVTFYSVSLVYQFIYELCLLHIEFSEV